MLNLRVPYRHRHGCSTILWTVAFVGFWRGKFYVSHLGICVSVLHVMQLASCTTLTLFYFFLFYTTLNEIAFAFASNGVLLRFTVFCFGRFHRLKVLYEDFLAGSSSFVATGDRHCFVSFPFFLFSRKHLLLIFILPTPGFGLDSQFKRMQ